MKKGNHPTVDVRMHNSCWAIVFLLMCTCISAVVK